MKYYILPFVVLKIIISSIFIYSIFNFNDTNDRIAVTQSNLYMSGWIFGLDVHHQIVPNTERPCQGYYCMNIIKDLISQQNVSFCLVAMDRPMDIVGEEMQGIPNSIFIVEYINIIFSTITFIFLIWVERSQRLFPYKSIIFSILILCLLVSTLTNFVIIANFIRAVSSFLTGYTILLALLSGLEFFIVLMMLGSYLVLYDIRSY
jgi:hypothetical protein